MNSNYTTVVGAVIAMLFLSLPTNSQTTILDCTSNTLSLCVNDPGVTLPDNNQFIVGAGTPGATSCSVHLSLSRRISGTCAGEILYGVALIIDDTVQVLLQHITPVTLDSLGNGVITFDTRTADDPQIRMNGIPYNTGCADRYEIEWYVADECGDEELCEESLELYDCQAPEVTVITGTTTLSIPGTCQLTLFAGDYVVNATDDCMGQADFLFSLSADSLVPHKPLDYCALGLGILTSFPVWAADQGRDLDCNGSIEWLERSLNRYDIPVVITEPGHCECFDNHTLSGKIYTEAGNPVPMVEVNLIDPGTQHPTFVTGGDGEYYFTSAFGPFEDVTISPSRNDNHRNGISTLDVVLIYKHLIHVQPLNSPYKLIAADVNRSQNLTALDIVELRKVILGIYPEFPHSKSWAFVDAKYDFPAPFNPWFHDTVSTHDFSVITIPYATDTAGNDFIGIKIGDVNNTIRGNLQSISNRDELPVVQLTTPQQTFRPGEIVEIPISIEAGQQLQGFQFTLETADLEVIDIKSNACHMESDAYYLMQDKVSVSWYDIGGVTVQDGDVLFTIVARAKQAGAVMQSIDLNSSVAAAELFDEAENLFEPQLRVISDDPLDIGLLPATPNPFRDETVIPFYLQRPSTVIITITNVDGRVLHEETVPGHAGRNEIVVRDTGLDTAGLLLYTLRTTQGMASGKMVRIE